MKDNSSPESRYWKIGPVYIKKMFLLTLIIAGAIAVMAKFGMPVELLPSRGEEPESYRYDDEALLELSEEVLIRDKDGRIRYEGPIDKGVITGVGRIYDAQGRLCYEGPLLENRCEGNDARVYRNGRLCYEGAMKDNRYDGPGKLYDYLNSEVREGAFLNGLLEGNARIYAMDGTLLREGNFINGVEQKQINQRPVEENSTDTLPPEQKPSLPERLKNWIFDFLWELLG